MTRRAAHTHKPPPSAPLPTHPKPTPARARVEAQRRNRSRARRLYREALAADPAHLQSLLGLGQLEARTGNCLLALQVCVLLVGWVGGWV